MQLLCREIIETEEELRRLSRGRELISLSAMQARGKGI